MTKYKNLQKITDRTFPGLEMIGKAGRKAARAATKDELKKWRAKLAQEKRDALRQPGA